MPIDQQMSGTSSGLKPGADTGNPGIAVPPPPLKSKKNTGGKEIKLTPPPKKLKDIVDINPTTTFGEAKEKHAVMTFGRMNPPTSGHEKLIHKVHSIAQDPVRQPHHSYMQLRSYMLQDMITYTWLQDLIEYQSTPRH